MKKIVNYLCAPRLRVENLDWTNSGKKIVSDISLSLFPGEVLCLLGDSGCGKTSLLRLISGLEKEDSGEIFINEEIISSKKFSALPENRPVSMIFQDYALFPHMTVYQNIAYGVSALQKEQKKSKIDKIIRDLDIQEHLKKYPHELSGGEQQRVALARAIAPEPLILLMDEPFSGLDRSLREYIREETISLLRNSQAAIILVTHDPEEAMLVGDRIALMRNGKINQIGTNDEMIFQPINDYTVSTFSNVNTYQSVIKNKKVETPFGFFEIPDNISGNQAKILIRDQAFQIVNPTENNSYKVNQIDYTGENSRIELRATNSDTQVKITVPGKTSVKLDDKIGLSVDERYVHIF
ncbi:MAG: ABC transporter ATP-binding protein [Alphaproteobacteria bacterium]|nr:ABC transporter ATP-binding protein [Alphaproteobacteria bacterium]